MPPGQLPPVFHTIGTFTPNGWTLRGVQVLVAGDAQLASLFLVIAVLVTFAGCGAAIGLLGLRRNAAFVA